MMRQRPSEELEKLIVWELDNIHLKPNAPPWAVKEFKEVFGNIGIIDKRK